jgi:hypothetical protein
MDMIPLEENAGTAGVSPETMSGLGDGGWKGTGPLSEDGAVAGPAVSGGGDGSATGVLRLI